MRPLLLLAAIGTALVLFAKKGAAQPVPPSKPKGPPRYVNGYDRLPSLQAELTKRQQAVAQAERVIASRSQYAPPSDQMLADMRAIVQVNGPKIKQLSDAIAEIARAGQL